jgi:hypothetical protein
MRYVILYRAVQQGPSFTTEKEALVYAVQQGFVKDGEKLEEPYKIVEVSEWKK